jgi:4-hydroxy-tetrahydrodipicolinate synthase
MPAYTRGEARDWARETLIGAVNCTIPSFTQDLKSINEQAIRHDARLARQHGFAGTLTVSEVNITPDEYINFLEVVVDEVGPGMHVVHHASWNTLEDSVAVTKRAEAAGAEVVLLSYPPNFYPESEQEIYDYTKTFCDSTNLAVILFPHYLWGFGPRIHQSDFPVRLMRRLLDDCPNIAVIKAEGGYPSIQGPIECYRNFGDEVIISVPIENDLIPLSQLMPIQYSATSNHEYLGDLIPKVMNLLRDGKYDEASEFYWSTHAARKAFQAVSQKLNGGYFLNRQAWKFEGWLQGYNGGPLRLPTTRIHDGEMLQLRKGLLDSGLQPSMDPFREFFIGRNPA